MSPLLSLTFSFNLAARQFVHKHGTTNGTFVGFNKSPFNQPLSFQDPVRGICSHSSTTLFLFPFKSGSMKTNILCNGTCYSGPIPRRYTSSGFWNQKLSRSEEQMRLTYHSWNSDQKNFYSIDDEFFALFHCVPSFLEDPFHWYEGRNGT